MTDYMNENYKRTNIEKIVEFLLYGSDSYNEVDDSIGLEKKLYDAEQKLNDCLHKLIANENNFDKVIEMLCDTFEYNFALGVKAGAKICINLLQ